MRLDPRGSILLGAFLYALSTIECKIANPIDIEDKEHKATVGGSIPRANTPTTTDRRGGGKLLFKIGLIVPKTSFLSQYKTYNQRIRDTFSQLIQSPRHLHKLNSIGLSSISNTATGNPSTATGGSGQLTFEPVPSASRCSSENQHYRRTSWPNLTFYQYFDFKVAELVSLSQRSSAQDIIDSMCQKLIQQNVSIIIYLENNQDQAVSSLDTPSLTKTQSGRLVYVPQKLTSQYFQNTEEVIKEIKPKDLRRPVQPTSSQAHFIMHLANSAGIPMIAWSLTASLAQRPKRQRTLHLAPTVAHEAKAIVAIMERYSWYTFSVVSTTLAGHEDFILALRQLIATSNSYRHPQTRLYTRQSPTNPTFNRPVTTGDQSNTVNEARPSDGQNGRSYNPHEPGGLPPTSPPSRVRKFKLLDAITIKKHNLSDIEEELRKLTVSESRVILLYATKGEAIDIFKVAKRLKLTKRSHVWIVAQSVIGPNENERAPMEFHSGLLGIYFRSNHEKLLGELSRAINIVAHGLERLVRDKDNISSLEDGTLGLKLPRETIEMLDRGQYLVNISNHDDHNHLESNRSNRTKSKKTSIVNASQPRSSPVERLSLRDKFYQKLLSAYPHCSGRESNDLSEIRGDLLYEYFRKSSPSDEFDANGSLKDVELNVVNLDNDQQWRKIGCFSDATLTIDDITWPEQAQRPPSGTIEKFHLRAVFLEEPGFVNLADPDTETGECKTNRAVRCRYKRLEKLSRQTQMNSGQIASEKPVVHHRQGQRRNSSQENASEYEYKCCSGFSIDLMEKFATDLKFSYDLYRVPDGLWGILENDTWNGLIGEITRGRADVIVSSIKINSDRQKAVDFTVPFLDTGISILVAKQTGLISKSAFLDPFDTQAWIMFTVVGIPLATLSIFFFEWLSPNGFYAGRSRKEVITSHGLDKDHNRAITITTIDHHKFSISRTLWLVITILFGSAAHIDSPKGYTARFMSNIWAAFAVVFLAVYTANLAAFMITREEHLDLTGISDGKLAYPYYKQPALKFGTINGGNTHAVLRANKPNLYNYMRRFNRASVEEGVEAVKTGQLDAFVYDALVLDYMAAQDPECKLVNVGSWYSMTGYGLAFSRNSRYYDKFNMKMLDYRKNGELDRLRRFWLQGLCKPGQNRHSISKPLDISQFMSAFYLLGAGIFVSVLTLVLEHLYIICIRDRLITSKHREWWIRLLYPFSLSLTDTLRLPSDVTENRGNYETITELEAIVRREDCQIHSREQNESFVVKDSKVEVNGLNTVGHGEQMIMVDDAKLIETLGAYEAALDSNAKDCRNGFELDHLKMLVRKLKCSIQNAGLQDYSKPNSGDKQFFNKRSRNSATIYQRPSKSESKIKDDEFSQAPTSSRWASCTVMHPGNLVVHNISDSRYRKASAQDTPASRFHNVIDSGTKSEDELIIDHRSPRSTIKPNKRLLGIRQPLGTTGNDSKKSSRATWTNEGQTETLL